MNNFLYVIQSILFTPEHIDKKVLEYFLFMIRSIFIFNDFICDMMKKKINNVM